MTHRRHGAADNQDETPEQPVAKVGVADLPSSGWRWLGLVVVFAGILLPFSTSLPGWLPWPFVWLLKASMGSMAIYGLLWVATSYAWNGEAVITRLGPFKFREQKIQPAALWADRKLLGTPILLTVDTNSAQERPSIRDPSWTRRQRENGDVIVATLDPVPAPKWADIIGVPLRLYQPDDDREAG